jgi:sigma-B regulation protein RsbQ
MTIVQRNNVTITGEGSETILFAHGFGCDKNTWRHVSKSFEQSHRVVLFDYVGAGNSDIASYDSKRYGSLAGYADDLIEICRELNLKDCIVVGHSVSCMIAVLASIKAPGFFSKLIFVCPSPYYLNEGDYIGGLEKEDLESLFSMMNSNYLGWSSVMAPAIMGNAHTPELGDELAASFCSTNPEIAKEFARVTFFSDHRRTLSQLNIETVTLQTADDILAPPEIGVFIQREVPLNKLINLKATGHCPHLSAPKEVIFHIKNNLLTACKN